MIYRSEIMAKLGKESISKLDEILKNLSKRKFVNQQKITAFYGYLETIYDDELQQVEDTILRELKNNNKQESILKLIDKMEIDNGNTQYK